VVVNGLLFSSKASVQASGGSYGQRILVIVAVGVSHQRWFLMSQLSQKCFVFNKLTLLLGWRVKR
jgi:hypothetical protein